MERVGTAPPVVLATLCDGTSVEEYSGDDIAGDLAPPCIVRSHASRTPVLDTHAGPRRGIMGIIMEIQLS